MDARAPARFTGYPKMSRIFLGLTPQALRFPPASQAKTHPIFSLSMNVYVDLTIFHHELNFLDCVEILYGIAINGNDVGK